MKVTINCQLVSEGQYYLNGTRLTFDYPWAIYIVNGDMVIPYYRIYINGRMTTMTVNERQARDYLLRLSKEAAHDPSARSEGNKN